MGPAAFDTFSGAVVFHRVQPGGDCNGDLSLVRLRRSASTASTRRRSKNTKRGFAAWMCKAQWLKALEDEQAKLKKLLAEAMLDLAVLKEVTTNKW